MKKSQANQIARDAYRLLVTRGISETCRRDYHTNYFPEENTIIVFYVNPRNEDDVLEHHCKVRKSWINF